MIALEGVHKSYGDARRSTRALCGVSLTVTRGSFVSCMGPSGSGKSTLLHIVGALEAASAGTVRVDGVRLDGLGDRELTELRRLRIGFVFQFFNLLATMSALENVMLPALLAGTSAARARAAATVLLRRVGLGDRLPHRPAALSGGEMQRVALARALINGPALLLADEPTGNLDSATGQDVLALLRAATIEREVTVLMVTHDRRAAAIGDRLLVLRDGAIVSDGPPPSSDASAGPP